MKIMCHLQNQSVLIIHIMIVFIGNSCHHANRCDASVQVHHQSSKADYQSNGILQEKMDQLKIPKDQKLIVRLPSNTLLKYTAYKDVSILHFRIPPDTKTAFFTFKAFEESKSAFQRKCKPRDVTLHLKAGSYPVISPENITFPRNFLSAGERFKIYEMQFQSDEAQQRITVEGPQIGNWFAVAFVSWTDPNSERIEQQGLAASCETLLLAEMAVTQFRPIILNTGQGHNEVLMSIRGEQNSTGLHKITKPTQIPLTSFTSAYGQRHNETDENAKFTHDDGNSTANRETVYKFYVPQDIATVRAHITIANVCSDCPDVGFYVQSNALPRIEATDIDDSHYMHSTIIKPNQTGEISVEFYVQPKAWHYAQLKFVGIFGEPGSPLISHFEKLGASPSIRSAIDLQQTPQRKQHGLTLSKVTKDTQYKLEYSIEIKFNEPVVEEATPTHAVNDHSIGNDTSEKTNDFTNSKSNGTRPVTSNSWQPKRFRNMEFYPLLRQTYREFFMFDYDLIPDANGTVPTLLNLTAGTPAGFVFDVGDVYDIGGTLSFAVSMKHGLKGTTDFKAMPALGAATERNGILAEKLVGPPAGKSEEDLEETNEDEALPRSNQTIIVCMRLGEPGEPTWPDKCRYGRKLLPAASIVNNTDSNTSSGLVHVPFPESGQWYVTMGLYCHGAETAARVTIIDSVKEFVKKYAEMFKSMRPPCACANAAPYFFPCLNDRMCLTAMNETDTLKLKECLMDSKCTHNHAEMTKKFETHHKFATEQHFALDNCTTSVIFAISSSPCVAGRCGRFGRCFHYMSGGFVFSTCVCMKGYRGWDCTEDTQVPSSISILLASLMLTLSNLLFLPSIYMAAHRKYYTEAVIYFFAMFFSIFYHACDSGEDEYSFCLAKIGVLQFCDFYCGLLAIWVTLVAMSHIRPQFVSLLHMLGAILLAFGTELNKQSLWVFLAPALTGVCIISTSWGLHCHKSRKWYPAGRYLTVYMPLGIVLVMVGLVCYAFLQTKQNYHIVHSIWHMVMALSILCLLPSRKSFAPKC